MGVGGGWEAEDRQHHPQGGKQQCYVFSRAQKLNLVGRDSRQQQFDTPGSLNSAALLVPISGPIDLVVDCRGFTVSAKDCL